MKQYPGQEHNSNLAQILTLNNILQMEQCHGPVQNTYLTYDSKLGGPNQNEPSIHNGVCLSNQQNWTGLRKEFLHQNSKQYF
jgi:hypothetical protein